MKKITDQMAYARLLERHTKTQIAKMLGISKQALTRWDTVPLRYVVELSEKTGVPKRDLLPSVFA